jgi:hypothetical protein
MYQLPERDPGILPFPTLASLQLDQDPRPNRLPRPSGLATVANRYWPKLWQYIDVCRADPKQRDPHRWPSSVFVPSSVIQDWLITALLPVRKDRGADLNDDEVNLLRLETVLLATIAAWRPTQGIYRFDTELSEELMNTPLTGDLPCDVLHYLPEWCVYVETPLSEKIGSYGFFACLDSTTSPSNERQLALHLTFDTIDYLYHTYVPLRKAPLLDLLQDVYQTVPASTRMFIHMLIQPAISLLLYICATNAEIGDGARRPAQPRPTKTKDGWRMFPATKPMMWDVGVRLGSALRLAKAAHTDQGIQPTDQPVGSMRTGPRPHIRRAHWHCFWHGRRDEPEKRTLQLHWVHPIAVKVDAVEDLPAVIRTVKKPGDST